LSPENPRGLTITPEIKEWGLKITKASTITEKGGTGNNNVGGADGGGGGGGNALGNKGDGQGDGKGKDIGEMKHSQEEQLFDLLYVLLNNWPPNATGFIYEAVEMYTPVLVKVI
jgi:hypothetical protein